MRSGEYVAGRGKTILVVEDDPVNGLVLLDYLDAKGYRVLLAKTGTAGIEAFEIEQPDMALVDVLLPLRNGFEVCFEMKRRRPDVPVLLMSAIYKHVSHAQAYAKNDLQAAGFLVKPFELPELLEHVQALIGAA
jgi:CheY-like chemotaxis protein